MAEYFHRAWAWKMAFFKGINGYLIALACALAAAGVFNEHWTKIILSFVAANKFLDGFLDQTITNTARFNNPLGKLGDSVTDVTKQP